MGSVFLSFALGCSHLPKNSILSAKRQFSARFSNCSNSLNFEAKINCNTTKPNVPKWRKRCTGLKLDLVPFNGPQMQFLSDHNFEGPCILSTLDVSPLPRSAREVRPCLVSAYLRMEGRASNTGITHPDLGQCGD